MALVVRNKAIIKIYSLITPLSYTCRVTLIAADISTLSATQMLRTINSAGNCVLRFFNTCRLLLQTILIRASDRQTFDPHTPIVESPDSRWECFRAAAKLTCGLGDVFFLSNIFSQKINGLFNRERNIEINNSNYSGHIGIMILITVKNVIYGFSDSRLEICLLPNIKMPEFNIDLVTGNMCLPLRHNWKIITSRPSAN